jgi:hypothetical protein
MNQITFKILFSIRNVNGLVFKNKIDDYFTIVLKKLIYLTARHKWIQKLISRKMKRIKTYFN